LLYTYSNNLNILSFRDLVQL